MSRLHICKCGSDHIAILVNSNILDYSQTFHRIKCLDCGNSTLSYEDVEEVLFVWNILSAPVKNQHEYEEYEKDESNNDKYVKMINWFFLENEIERLRKSKKVLDK